MPLTAVGLTDQEQYPPLYARSRPGSAVFNKPDPGGPEMNANLDDLATTLYVTVDDTLKTDPSLAPYRPNGTIEPKLSDAELVTLAVIQALLGYHNEAQFIRYAHTELASMFPHLPGRSGYNKRLRHAQRLLLTVLRLLAQQCDVWHDNVWLIDSTPVECARSRTTVQRSDLAGAAGYGYCASHSRFFWGFRLHLITTPTGLPVAFAVASAKDDERLTARDIFEVEPGLLKNRHGQVIIADKGYKSAEFETFLNSHGVTLIRPATKGEKKRCGAEFLRPLRQIIESVNQTLKAQLDLERHGARKLEGVGARIAQRLLALTTAIWYNEQHHNPTRRSLTAFDT